MRRLQFLASGPARSFLAEPHAGASSILINELNTGRFQNALDRFEVVRHGHRPTCLKISDGTFADLRLRGELGLRKFD